MENNNPKELNMQKYTFTVELVNKEVDETANIPPPPIPRWPSRSHGQHCKKALLVEGTREAEPELQSRGYATTRNTHCELMSHLGARYTSEPFDPSYDLLWIPIPLDWYLRLPGKRTAPH